MLLYVELHLLEILCSAICDVGVHNEYNSKVPGILETLWFTGKYFYV